MATVTVSVSQSARSFPAAGQAPGCISSKVGTMAEAFVYDAIRTPRGKGKKDGSLHEVKPVDLVVTLLDEVRKRNDGFDIERVDDVVLGVVSPIGDQGGDIAKTAALKA